MNNFKILAYVDDIAIINTDIEKLRKEVNKANKVV